MLSSGHVSRSNLQGCPPSPEVSTRELLHEGCPVRTCAFSVLAAYEVAPE